MDDIKIKCERLLINYLVGGGNSQNTCGYLNVYNKRGGVPQLLQHRSHLITLKNLSTGDML